MVGRQIGPLHHFIYGGPGRRDDRESVSPAFSIEKLVDLIMGAFKSDFRLCFELYIRGDFSSSVRGRVKAAIISSNTSSIPFLIFSATVDSHAIVVPKTRTPGIPLPEAAEWASFTKPRFASNTTGVPKSSMATPLYARNFVQEPQSPTAPITASISFAQAVNSSLFTVSVSADVWEG